VMLKFENHFRLQGKKCIAGIDEVGRGPFAGPVVACAVVLPEKFDIKGINDSKKIPEKERFGLFNKLIEYPGINFGLGIVSERIIDSINILNATKIAMKEAVLNLPVKPDHLLIDGLFLDELDVSQTKIIKGDNRSMSIASASIIAKVVRDALMGEYEVIYPGYNLTKNKGYGTREHIQAIKEKGISFIHRRSFVPAG